MLTLLLVDDERITRQGICNTIGWEELGIGEVFQAANGKEALELFERHLPDIVMSDVKMPVMDGIQLAKEIKRKRPNTPVIFMSGYSDVGYLKAAVQESAVDYILKPIDQDDLEEAVKKAVDAVGDTKKRQRLHQEMKGLIDKYRPYYQRDFIARVQATNAGLPELKQQFALCGFPFADHDSFTAALLHLEYGREENGPEIALLATEAEQLLARYVAEKIPCGILYRNNESMFTLVWASSSQEVTPSIFQDIIQFLDSRLPVRCSVGVGSGCMGIYDISESIQCAERALSRTFYEGVGNVYFYTGATQDHAISLQPSLDLVKQVCIGIVSHNLEISRNAIQNLTEELEAQEFVNMDYLWSYCAYFFSAVLSQLYSQQNQMDITHLDLLIRVQTVLPTCRTAADMTQFLISVLDDLNVMFSKSPRSSGEVLAQEVEDYLERHYGEDITIQELSVHFYITPAYLCRLFKKETSKTINEALREIRIEKAKELLRQGDFRLYDIAPKVGYQDIKYFSRMFKAYTGLSPSEYRQMYRA